MHAGEGLGGNFIDQCGATAASLEDVRHAQAQAGLSAEEQNVWTSQVVPRVTALPICNTRNPCQSRPHDLLGVPGLVRSHRGLERGRWCARLTLVARGRCCAVQTSDWASLDNF